MTNKERVHATLEGKPVDHFPATALYNFLYHCDHFSELTGRPAWELWKWRHESPEDHLATYRVMVEQAPFDILQPQPASSRQTREQLEFFERDGHVVQRNRKTGACTPLRSVSGHPADYVANQTRHLLTRDDIKAQVRIIRSESLIAAGCNDYAEAAVRTFGQDQFILTGGVVGTLWGCNAYVGQLNLMAMLVEEPDLVDELSRRILEQHIETIRQLAAAGGDAIYIDDATATSDMISVRHYERFSLPYVREMVREIHRLGHKAIVLYFGGVADRLDQIASLGADGLSVETTMKNYVNDIGQIATAVGRQVSLFGNVDPIRVLEKGTEEELEYEVRRQATAGRQARGFVLCTGSPITPRTPLARVQRFLELGRQQGTARA